MATANNGKYKTLTVTSLTGESVYALVIRSIDGYILDNSSGFFGISPSNYGISLTEVSTVYSTIEARSVWVDGIYSIAYYTKVGANPDVSADTLIQVSTSIVQNDVIINTEVISGDAASISLSNGKIIVGNASGVGTAVSVTGIVTLANTGATGLALANGKIFVGNGSGAGAAVSVSGDVTLANTGAVALVSIPSAVQDAIVRLGTLTTKLVTAAGSAAAGAMFNLPTSAADPTTPVEGDIWKTATAVRGFINGALVTFDVTVDTP